MNHNIKKKLKILHNPKDGSLDKNVCKLMGKRWRRCSKAAQIVFRKSR